MKPHRNGRLSRKVLLALSLGAFSSGCGGAEVSGDVGITPVDDVALSLATVVLNEVSSQDGDQIEFFNHGAESVDLSGWSYSDQTRLPTHTFVFPAGTEIGPGEFLVMSREQAHDFGLGRDDAVVLFDAEGLVVDEADWADGEALISYCRYPNGTGPWTACDTRTMGWANGDVGPSGAPLLEPVWIADGLGEPNELGFDHQGRLWAGDVLNYRVLIYDRLGELIAKVGGAGDGPGHFVVPESGKGGPEAIRTNSAGDVLVVDRGGARINVYSSDTLSPLGTITCDCFEDPTGLAIDSHDYLYVADQAQNAIHKLTPDGSFVETFETHDETGEQILAKPETLALVEDKGLLLATSEDESRIELFELWTGRYVGLSIGGRQVSDLPEPGRFGDDVEGIAVHQGGQLLFTSDEENGRIMVHDLRGGYTRAGSGFGFVGAFGTVGDAAGQLRSADGIAVDEESGWVAVADQGNDRVQVFLVEEISALEGMRTQTIE